MPLYLQIDHAGFISINETSTLSIHENAKVQFRYETEEPGVYQINIGDYAARLHLSRSSTDSVLRYDSDHLECFKNFVGVCPIGVSSDDGDELGVRGAVNIYATKATYDRAISFLRFIVQHQDFSSACFSVSRASSNASRSHNDISAKIEAGIKVITHMHNEWGRFKADPCVKRNVESETTKYLRNQEIGPDAVAYIAQHPDLLDRTGFGQGDIQIRGRQYVITSTVTSRTVNDANVQENQFLLQFLADFHLFLMQLERQFSKSTKKLKDFVINETQYISIDHILNDSGLFLNFHEKRIKNAIRQALDLIMRFERELAVKFLRQMKANVVPTQQVLVRSHYFQAYNLIKDYLRTGEPSWQGEQDLYGLRNMPKLYEFVVLLSLIEGLKAKGFELECAYFSHKHYGPSERRAMNEPNNFYQFKRGSEVVNLFYDMSALQMKQLDLGTSLGVPVDIKHSSARTWRPDFYVVHRLPGCADRTHVLDAKYSSASVTESSRLPECSFKYTTCMKVLGANGNQPILKNVDSMILIHSESNSRTKLINDKVRRDAPSFISMDNLSPQVGLVGITERAGESSLESLLEALKIY